jgi:hypothetical protein
VGSENGLRGLHPRYDMLATRRRRLTSFFFCI